MVNTNNIMKVFFNFFFPAVSTVALCCFRCRHCGTLPVEMPNREPLEQRPSSVKGSQCVFNIWTVELMTFMHREALGGACSLGHKGMHRHQTVICDFLCTVGKDQLMNTFYWNCIFISHYIVIVLAVQSKLSNPLAANLIRKKNYIYITWDFDQVFFLSQSERAS